MVLGLKQTLFLVLKSVAFGLWPLAFGLWSLVFGLWSLAFGRGLMRSLDLVFERDPVQALSTKYQDQRPKAKRPRAKAVFSTPLGRSL